MKKCACRLPVFFEWKMAKAIMDQILILAEKTCRARKLERLVALRKKRLALQSEYDFWVMRLRFRIQFDILNPYRVRRSYVIPVPDGTIISKFFGNIKFQAARKQR